jgi:hypothetical protein
MTSKKKNRKTIVRWNLIELGCRMLALVSLVCIHVMRGLVPRIHVFGCCQGVDGRDKPGHDDI